MYSNNNNSVSEDCWSTFKCLIKFIHPAYSTCDQLCDQNQCKEMVMTSCPDFIFFPNVPILFGNIYFVHKKNDLRNRTNFSTLPLYICFNTFHYNDFFVNITKVFIHNMTCIDSQLFLSPTTLETFATKDLYMDIIKELYRLFKRYHLSFNYTSSICNRSNMYQCLHSFKCISIYRLLDNVYDCPHGDDENIIEINKTNVIEQLKKTYFKCEISNKYILQTLVENGECDCKTNESTWCEDEDLNVNYIRRNILFQYICDRLVHLSLLMIVEQNGTDETECEQWQCNNIYTRCDGIWNCLNGADESGCHSHPILNCSSKHHLCVSRNTNQFMCLPIEKGNDGNIDCLGATDEPELCDSNVHKEHQTFNNFHCINQSSQSCISVNDLCDGKKQCTHGDDEQFCTTNQGVSICRRSDLSRSDVEQFLCRSPMNVNYRHMIYFKLDELMEPVQYEAKSHIENTMPSSSSIIIKMSNQHQTHCHRGLDVRVWLNNKTEHTCLCPPSYYGSQCQYQNQRISLAIKFQAFSDSLQTLFAIVITLIDDSNQRIIHSYEQFTYLSIRNCEHKFNVYLLYSTRPKDSTKTYAIHIDIYEKEPFKYRGSFLFPIYFSFLPVHRLAFLVDIPRNNTKTPTCSNDECIHGECIKYYNNQQNLTFCKCDQGWSGRYCTIQHTCTCSSQSLCMGISANNRSICICPLHKFGSRCLLTDTICQKNLNSTCQNNGQCIPDNDYFGPYKNFTCICPTGYSGKRCEIADNKLILSFNESIVLPQSIFIHFFEVTLHDAPIRGTIFKTIPLRQDSVTIHWGRPFNLAFIEIFNDSYYLVGIQNTSRKSIAINEMINPSDRCPNISELFNKTFVQWNLIRRIKYYHLPCQNQSLNLSCFYDDVHLCLCYYFRGQRLSNCFNFNHSVTFNCGERSECENDGQCLQDRPNCPTRSTCICLPCFYGRRCQFSTSGFGLSLDAILGYHISPKLSLTQQSFIIKMSLSLTIIFILIGFLNGILCIITFQNKIVREVGCGLYLLGSSITTLFTMFMFGFKFLILILAQMTIITNRTFIQVQCHSLDFLLRVCLSMDQWLNACVAMERAITIIKATRFDKKKSKRAAKYVIIILLIVIIGTSIHDPIHRHLIDEENDDDDNMKRTWCIIKYSFAFQIYDYFINSFHFFGPFLINLISSIILITKKSRQQLTIYTQRTYREVLREQIREHKHLLTAPIVLVILALPRLIIIFISKCMKSPDDAWLFLVGYFISFIPPMLTFLVFIVPSKFYKKQLRQSVKQYQTTIQRRLRLL